MGRPRGDGGPDTGGSSWSPWNIWNNHLTGPQRSNSVSNLDESLHDIQLNDDRSSTPTPKSLDSSTETIKPESSNKGKSRAPSPTPSSSTDTVSSRGWREYEYSKYFD